MKKNHALMMALSALSAGLLISCVKPVDDNQSTTVESQEVAPDTAINDKAADDQRIDSEINKKTPWHTLLQP